VGGLAHYLESEGLATTQISLIREHTEIIKPPRALWVPFELGRPLGVPDDPAFQTRVLLSALRLLEATSGPVLRDFNEDAPSGDTHAASLSCPIDFETPSDLDEGEILLYAFEQEVLQLRNWYDTSVKTRGRTTTGTTGLEPEAVAEFISAFVRGESPDAPVKDVPYGFALKMAADDLKAYYIESVISQPGQPTDSNSLADWFWNETRAAKVLHTVREICINSGDDELKRFGGSLLVPRERI
jgi:hypothetical protein